MATGEITLYRILHDIYDNWGTLASIAANILILVNRKKIPQWESEFRNRKVKNDFKQGVKDLEKKANEVKKDATTRGFTPAAEPVIDFGQQEQREFVLEAWGALKQNVLNACTVNRISVTQSTGIPDAVGLLRSNNIIGPDIAFLMKALFSYGEKISNAKFLIPPEDQARSYITSVFFVVDWLKKAIFTPPSAPTAAPPPRPTVVGPFFPKPQQGLPSALLVGMSGNLKGQRFPIDKELYRIGSNRDNDLYIRDDDFVSGNHAYLSYQQGSLFLSDQDSRNGTFLNDQLITKSPTAVKNGDYIRFGETVFQVTESDREEDDKGSQQPTSRRQTPVE